MPPCSSGSQGVRSHPNTHRRRPNSLSLPLLIATILLIPSTIAAINPRSAFFASAATLDRRAPPARNPHMNQAVEEPSSQVLVSASPTALTTSIMSSQPLSQSNSSRSTPSAKPASIAPSASTSVAVAVNGVAPAPAAQVYAIDLQSFSKGLAGVNAPSIVQSPDPGKPFQVDDETFADFQSAAAHSCDVQMDNCRAQANKPSTPTPSPQNNSNRNKGNTLALSQSDCTMQKERCMKAQQVAVFQTFALEDVGADPLDPEFEILCLP